MICKPTSKKQNFGMSYCFECTSLEINISSAEIKIRIYVNLFSFITFMLLVNYEPQYLSIIRMKKYSNKHSCSFADQCGAV